MALIIGYLNTVKNNWKNLELNVEIQINIKKIRENTLIFEVDLHQKVSLLHWITNLFDMLFYILLIRNLVWIKRV
jgi:hypothetical protein